MNVRRPPSLWNSDPPPAVNERTQPGRDDIQRDKEHGAAQSKDRPQGHTRAGAFPNVKQKRNSISYGLTRSSANSGRWSEARRAR
jgi:hypothetical protein